MPVAKKIKAIAIKLHTGVRNFLKLKRLKYLNPLTIDIREASIIVKAYIKRSSVKFSDDKSLNTLLRKLSLNKNVTKRTVKRIKKIKN